MIRSFVFAAVIVSAIVQASDPQTSSDLPKEIAVPDGSKLLFKLHGKGVQVYEASAGASGKLEWKFLSPLADLTEVIDSVNAAGFHYDGPSWEALDGSKVTKVDAKSAPAPGADDIPWLLVTVKAADGPSGKMSPVTCIQRLNTSGGKAPAQPPMRAGTRVGVPYEAEYLFYGKTP